MKWTLHKKKIKDLYENPKNPRRLDKYQAAHLQESISKFGLCEPIVINPDGLIIGGHQRVRTLKKMGYKEADVYIPDIPLEDKEIDELTIRLNKNTGDWDFDVLANNYDPADLVEYGFRPEELHLESIPGVEPQEEGQSPKSSAQMIITFKDSEHLQEAENRIAVIVDEYPGATYKVRVK